MKLSISNIAWATEENEAMYLFLKESGYLGMEIAPTKIIKERPYDYLEEAKKFADELKRNYNLEIPSLQSIWYGRNEKIFSSEAEREILAEYTKKAILFAEAVGAGNLVFGCPKNRVINSSKDIDTAIEFFNTLGEFAYEHGTTLSLEPNPVIYNTNFINYTYEAFDFVKRVKSEGFKVNVDIGTMIYNDERIEVLEKDFDLINHVHISEPGLVLIENRKIHENLMALLSANNYSKYVSIEMAQQADICVTKETVNYIKRLSSVD